MINPKKIINMFIEVDVDGKKMTLNKSLIAVVMPDGEKTIITMNIYSNNTPFSYRITENYYGFTDRLKHSN